MGSRRRLHGDSDHAELGERIRRARLKAGFTQVEVADHLDWTQSQVGKMERGERLISLLECREMCRLFGVSIDEIAND